MPARSPVGYFMLKKTQPINKIAGHIRCSEIERFALENSTKDVEELRCYLFFNIVIKEHWPARSLDLAERKRAKIRCRRTSIKPGLITQENENFCKHKVFLFLFQQASTDSYR